MTTQPTNKSADPIEARLARAEGKTEGSSRTPTVVPGAKKTPTKKPPKSNAPRDPAADGKGDGIPRTPKSQ